MALFAIACLVFLFLFYYYYDYDDDDYYYYYYYYLVFFCLFGVLFSVLCFYLFAVFVSSRLVYVFVY